jgi:hypothetical protein
MKYDLKNITIKYSGQIDKAHGDVVAQWLSPLADTRLQRGGRNHDSLMQ